ncbi:hypothetical protein PVAP13_3NG194100 [Panicum virgatum]|uniref:Uncharacterized protein n=1 Tax=Panicum virgatum TaxID=38727 RepID=A0A8T0UJX6_PANVG|nr:hypothetical protein PVAP13_3NG194100 [Panicum virgatum]
MLYNLLAQPLTLAEPTATFLPPPVRLRAATLLPLPLLLTPPADPSLNARIPGPPCRIRRLPSREGSSRSSRLGHGGCEARVPPPSHGRRGCSSPRVRPLLHGCLPSRRVVMCAWWLLPAGSATGRCLPLTARHHPPPAPCWIRRIQARRRPLAAPAKLPQRRSLECRQRRTAPRGAKAAQPAVPAAVPPPI